MPSQDLYVESEGGRDKDRDRDKDREHDANEKNDRAERSSSKQKPSTSQKTKDLSHVPCKFFKVGACTAGSSCPFSHNVPESGRKEVCAWFVKGNCKFGHKCALAHILPGQSMAMDRKNKKAALAATAAVVTTEKGASVSKEGPKDVTGKSITARKKDAHQGTSVVPQGGGMHGSGGTPHSGSGRNTALFTGGSTAPTRILRSSSTSASSVRPPINMPLKATISPSAPAPPLKDTDFSSFAALDEMEGVDVQQKIDSHSRDGSEPDMAISDAALGSRMAAYSTEAKRESQPPSPVPLPTSAPRPSAPLTTTDFGPIGSPPSAVRLNGALATRQVVGNLSPSTSPRSNSATALLRQRMNHDISLSPPSGRNAQSYLPPSPFSAPGAQCIFLSNSFKSTDQGAGPGFVGGTSGRDNDSMGAFNIGGVAASLGTGMALLTGNADDIDNFGVGLSQGKRGGRSLGMKVEQGMGDEDLEEFIPSSLSDLLTPEERRRRMSRSGHQPQAQYQQGQVGPVPTARLPNPGESLTSSASGHRYSRSVPATSLLGDLKSIWADPTSVNQRRGTPLISEGGNTLGLQVPTSKPVQNGGGNLLSDGLGLSMSVGSSSSITTHINAVSPSNASAAFLPGLHHHYLKAKQQGHLGLAAAPGSMANMGRNGKSVSGGAGLARSVRTASGPLFPGANINNNNLTTGNVGVHTQGGVTQTYRATPSPFDLTQPQHQHHNPANRALAGPGPDLLNSHYVSSPSARALQSHAPGQSLPQGLAAGLSRIHALPPLPALTSPSTSLTGEALPLRGHHDDWRPPASPAPSLRGMVHPSSTAAGGAAGAVANGPDANLSRMSYSAITRIGGGSAGDNNATSPALARAGTTTGRYQPIPGGQPIDDDDLFTMDG